MTSNRSMQKLSKAGYVAVSVITVIVMLGSVFSVFRNEPQKFLKMMDFPRQQFFVLSAICLVAFSIGTKYWRWYDYALIVGLVGGLVINGVYLINYTPIIPERVPTAAADHDPDSRFSVLLANVLQENRNAQPFLERVREKDADFVLAMEVDEWWNQQMQPIEDAYPYKQEVFNDVTYGMALYSKYPLENMKVSELHNDDVPSFQTTITLKNGRQFVLHTVHPVPPRNFKHLPDNEGRKERELTKVGQLVLQSKLPNVVMGDFNDVAWGFTDEITHTEDLLYDIRVGRGFYNTFNAKHWYMYWPIDHVLVTKEFQCNKIERLADISSDHWPIYAELVLPGE